MTKSKYKTYQQMKHGRYDPNVPKNGISPIIGVDPSDATHHDSTAITVIDSRTTRVCATFYDDGGIRACDEQPPQESLNLYALVKYIMDIQMNHKGDDAI